jgi:hypothetical protein
VAGLQWWARHPGLHGSDVAHPSERKSGAAAVHTNNGSCLALGNARGAVGTFSSEGSSRGFQAAPRRILSSRQDGRCTGGLSSRQDGHGAAGPSSTQHGLAEPSVRGRMMCIGLGGGSLPLFLSHHFPGADVEAVEVDYVVVRAAVEAMGLPIDRCATGPNVLFGMPNRTKFIIFSDGGGG